MNRFSSKSNLKSVLICFLIEISLLIICFIIAHTSINNSDRADMKQMADSMLGVNDNLLTNSFDGENMDAFILLKGNEHSTSKPIEDNCKYYTFSLSDEGIDTDVVKGTSGLEVNGLISNTATNTVIPECKSTTFLGKLKIQNDYVRKSLDIAKILSKPLVIEPMDESKILIYHVHGTEGYCETYDDKYSSSSSIKGDKNNVIEAGDVLQKTIQDKTGIKVLHDETIFEEGLESVVSYNNAAVKLDEIYASEKNIKLQVDLHRNAAQDGGVKYGPTVEANGTKYAQISFVVGLDYNEQLGEHITSINPYWEDNFRLCMLLIDKLEEKVPGIVRLIEFRRTPYNQNYAENSLLVEVGFNGNLTSEANRTAELFGSILSEIYG